MGSNSVISQASKCLCGRWGCLFEHGDWTLHWPSGMIRPTLICCYTDPHMQKKKSPYHIIPWAAWTGRLYRSREKQDHPGLQHENTHPFHQNINIHRSPAFVTNTHIRTCKNMRMLAHANSKANNGAHIAVDTQTPPRTNTQSNRYMICPCFRPALTVDERCSITERSQNRKQEQILKINLRVPRNTWTVSSRWAQKWQSSRCLLGYGTQLEGSKERHSGVIQCVSLLCVLWCNHFTEKVCPS